MIESPFAFLRGSAAVMAATRSQFRKRGIFSTTWGNPQKSVVGVIVAERRA
jgi:hypothetical protein